MLFLKKAISLDNFFNKKCHLISSILPHDQIKVGITVGESNVIQMCGESDDEALEGGGAWVIEG